MWERGNRELLEAIFARTLKKAPTAKELVFTLAEYVRPQLDFRCFAEPKSGEFGIVVRENYEPVLMTAPFSEKPRVCRADLPPGSRSASRRSKPSAASF